MEVDLSWLIPSIEWLKIYSIPVVAAIVGWITNLMAIKFMFYPIEFIGIKPIFGWQGIIPRKAEKITRATMNSVLEKLGGMPFFFNKMDPYAIAQQITVRVEPELENYINRVMEHSSSQLWQRIPARVKTLIYNRTREQMPQLANAIVLEVGENIEQLIDLDEFVIEKIKKDKTLLNKFFLESGDKELAFIIKSGLWLGGLFGIVQAIIWYFFSHNNWLLPLFGAIVGFATNWIALKIIFQPVDPKQLGPFTVQGLFIKRRNAVAKAYARLVAEEIFATQDVMKELFYGTYKQRTHNIILSCVKSLMDDVLGLLIPILTVTGQKSLLLTLRSKMAAETIELSYEALQDDAFNEVQSVALSTHIEIQMRKLDNKEYERLLRPAFEEDELKLILLGAALGFGAGLMQLFWVFGGSL